MEIKVGRGQLPTPSLHATVRLGQVWWQYRVWQATDHTPQSKLWRVSRAIERDGRMAFEGFVPCLEGEVPDEIREALIVAMMNARLANQV